MKKIFKCIVCLYIIINGFSLAQGYYYDPNNLINEIIKHFNTQNDTSFKEEILKIQIKTPINFRTLDEYQIVHDTIQNYFYPKQIFDIYRDSSGQIIIPSSRFKQLNDDISQYNSEDINFINNLSNYAITRVSIIDKKTGNKLPSIYYTPILYAISDVYNKYWDIVNINGKSLFTGLEFGPIDVSKDPRAIAEFVPSQDKLVISPDAINLIGYLDERDREAQIKYVIYHEMAHAIDQRISKNIFDQFQIRNLSDKSLNRLSQLYFFSDNYTQVGSNIMNEVLSIKGAPADENERKKIIINDIGEYATTNSSEFLAEAIAKGLYHDSQKFQQADNHDLVTKSYTITNKNRTKIYTHMPQYDAQGLTVKSKEDGISYLVDQLIRDITNRKGMVYVNIVNSIENFIKEQINFESFHL